LVFPEREILIGFVVSVVIPSSLSLPALYLEKINRNYVATIGVCYATCFALTLWHYGQQSNSSVKLVNTLYGAVLFVFIAQVILGLHN